MAKDIIATCICCGRQFSCSELFRQHVIEGKAESLCGYCDGSHDDHDFPPEPYDYPLEQEAIDEDKRHEKGE